MYLSYILFGFIVKGLISIGMFKDLRIVGRSYRSEVGGIKVFLELFVC